MNAFGGMFAAAAAAGYQDPYHRMAASLQDPQTAIHHHHAAAAAAHHHHHHHHHQYKVPRIYFKIPRVLPYKEQKEKFDSDDFFKKLQREGEVRNLVGLQIGLSSMLRTRMLKLAGDIWLGPLYLCCNEG